MARPLGECANCHQTRALGAKNLCTACYQYQRRTGNPRPDMEHRSSGVLIQIRVPLPVAVSLRQEAHEHRIPLTEHGGHLCTLGHSVAISGLVKAAQDMLVVREADDELRSGLRSVSEEAVEEEFGDQGLVPSLLRGATDGQGQGVPVAEQRGA